MFEIYTDIPLHDAKTRHPGEATVSSARLQSPSLMPFDESI